jgi:hypothetical protein
MTRAVLDAVLKSPALQPIELRLADPKFLSFLPYTKCTRLGSFGAKEMIHYNE